MHLISSQYLLDGPRMHCVRGACTVNLSLLSWMLKCTKMLQQNIKKSQDEMKEKQRNEKGKLIKRSGSVKHCEKR
ncbi:hypothetical protein Y1Q_0016763 [Alligator mississippiensis]|uniref:Uncharacterized protein n=1 Tax=Alligator mississippiensis TaxID=8496 RepID=A0A151P5W0_ALLMI|nr:hypothetical protein Y1Q_0016763 [Alligator mississippiensis]